MKTGRGSASKRSGRLLVREERKAGEVMEILLFPCSQAEKMGSGEFLMAGTAQSAVLGGLRGRL